MRFELNSRRPVAASSAAVLVRPRGEDEGGRLFFRCVVTHAWPPVLLVCMAIAEWPAPQRHTRTVLSAQTRDLCAGHRSSRTCFENLVFELAVFPHAPHETACPQRGAVGRGDGGGWFNRTDTYRKYHRPVSRRVVTTTATAWRRHHHHHQVVAVRVAYKGKCSG